jgi:hypothetical protein
MELLCLAMLHTVRITRPLCVEPDIPSPSVNGSWCACAVVKDGALVQWQCVGGGELDIDPMWGGEVDIDASGFQVALIDVSVAGCVLLGPGTFGHCIASQRWASWGGCNTHCIEWHCDMHADCCCLDCHTSFGTCMTIASIQHHHVRCKFMYGYHSCKHMLQTTCTCCKLTMPRTWRNTLEPWRQQSTHNYNLNQLCLKPAQWLVYQ